LLKVQTNQKNKAVQFFMPYFKYFNFSSMQLDSFYAYQLTVEKISEWRCAVESVRHGHVTCQSTRLAPAGLLKKKQ